MSQENPERKKILVEIFEQLSPDASKETMLERANAILTEAGQRAEYEGSIAISYASEAMEILNHPNYDNKKDSGMDIHDKRVLDNVAKGTLRQYCLYLLERARDNYVNEVTGQHSIIASAVEEFLDR